MREALIAAGLVVALVLFAALMLLPWETLLAWGSVLVASGFGFGVPTGVVYNVLLYRVLKRRGQVPRGWIWRPFALHGELDARQRRVVLPWAFAGGLGFFAIVVGQVVLVAAIVRAGIAG